MHSFYVFAVEDAWHTQDCDELCAVVVEIDFGIQAFVLDESDIVELSSQFLIGNWGQVGFLILLDLNLDLPDFAILWSSSVLVILSRASDDKYAIHGLGGV